MAYSISERKILTRIEDLRRGLCDLVTVKGLADQEVAEASRALDAMINKYYRLVEESKNKGKSRR
ncbi:MAG: aspartyl-phosphate phosphatase Spo0E family protein [Bacillota bacterium]